MDTQGIVTQFRLSGWGEEVKERIAGGQTVSVFCKESGHFRWPSSDGEATMALNSEELSCLIDSARLAKKLSRSEVFERKIS